MVTSINFSGLAPNSSLTGVTVKVQDDAATEAADGGAKVTADTSKLQSRGTNTSPTTIDEMIERLQKQIAEAQKLLQEQMQRMQQLQRRHDVPQDRQNVEVMAMQAQVVGTTTRLQALQASLFKLLGGAKA